MFQDFYDDFLSAAGALPDEFKTEERAEKYFAHLTELDEKGKLFNLTAITELKETTRLHVVDSLFAAKTIEELTGGEDATVVDVGSGAGFPALPIAIACGNARVTALDSTAKKCSFIEATAKKCGVAVSTVSKRAEEASELREKFDIAVARAVARLNILAEFCAPLVKVDGYFVAMKGSSADEESSEAESAASKLGLEFVRTENYTVDGGGDRSILVYKKTSPTTAEFPRRYSQIKKKPL